MPSRPRSPVGEFGPVHDRRRGAAFPVNSTYTACTEGIPLVLGFSGKTVTNLTPSESPVAKQEDP